ncbi:AAA family ATPase [Paraburkholderia sp. BR13439]|uniref:AAA family ATPase n=1 Tax=Paraburkholderia sp. BR13439 TaxID=3236996 RepID=UPI0034CFEE3D
MTNRAISATYLTGLTVQNAKSFKGRQELDLCDSRGHPSRWTLILGESGVGKTTLLQCIAATAPHKNAESSTSRSGAKPKFFLEAVGVIDDSVVKLLARDGNSEFAILSTYAENICLGGKSDRKPKTFQVGIRFSSSKSGDPFQSVTAKETADPEPLVLSYGAGRKMGTGNLEDMPPDALEGALFPDERELIDAEEVIQQLDYAAVKRKTKLARRQRDTFLAMLAQLLPDVESAENFVIYGPSPVGRNLKRGVHVRVPYGEVPLRQLSFGYQTMIAWLTDIAWQLFRHYPNSSHPLGEPAIVLVDEIDLHLHPRWQRKLQKLLSEHFPAVQFVATAHSPLMAQAAIGQNLAVVLRDGDTACIHNDPSVVDNWRIDQVVTSDLFGLAPWSPDVQEKLDEQAQLVQKTDRTSRDNRRLEELEHFASLLPTGLPPALEQAMDIIQRAASAMGRPKS